MPTVHFPPPAFDLAAIARIARERFGLDGVATDLPGERDRNARLDLADGRRYVVKIVHPETPRAEVELQHAVLAHLADRERELSLPRVVATPGGETLVEVADTAGHSHLARVVTYVPGRPWASVRPHGEALLTSLGTLLGRLDRGLADFAPLPPPRPFKWDLAQAGWIREYLDYLPAGENRRLVARWLAAFGERLGPALAGLRQRLVHNDANDWNVLVDGPPEAPWASGLIDFGDLTHTALVAEVAIAAAYAVMDLPDPVAGIARLLAGYHAVTPLREEELAVVHGLVCLRLAVSVTNAAYQRAVEPGNAYLAISETRAGALLERLSAVPERLATYTYRVACGYPAHPDAPRVVAWLRAHAGVLARVVEPDLSTAPLAYVDWSVGSPALGNPREIADAAGLSAKVEATIAAAGAVAGIGGYDEARPVYASDAYRHRGNDRDEWRTVHLGLDVFLPAGAPVYAPLAGEVASFADNAAPFDYGPTIVLRHEVEDAAGPLVFHTLYGHLSRASLDGLVVGRPVAAGERIATLGAADVNSGWPPHLHLQVILDMLEREGDFIGSCRPSGRDLWRSLCPDPNLLARVPASLFPPPPPGVDALCQRRRRLLGANLSLAYRRPLAIVRGFMQTLWDEDGQRYLDAYNNVPHVGHNHPRVVAAASAQLALLNTNTRYLHPLLLDYAERLLAHLPAPLAVCYFTASGSEANELALRLARTHTGGRDLVVMAAAYHGHTSALIDLSPYKHAGPGGEGAPDWVHVTPLPDPYRGTSRAGEVKAGGADAAAREEVGARCAAEVTATIEHARARGRRLAGFLAETFPSVGGQIVPPAGYFPAVYAAIRAAGGIAIADEVQTGFGRTGETFWAFERYGVVPDVVVLGKPIANGYPLGAVITTREVAASFANGMEFFSTFGGSTAAMAAALATLEVVEAEGLQAHAAAVGAPLLAGLRELAARHPVIGDVRGAGLFVGVELVRDRTTREPAGEEAAYVANRLRDRGILIGTDGVDHNVLKIRPPLCFDRADADRLVAVLDDVLDEDGARPIGER